MWSRSAGLHHTTTAPSSREPFGGVAPKNEDSLRWGMTPNQRISELRGAGCRQLHRAPTSRERNSRRRYFPVCSKPPISLRPNRPDADIEEKTRQRAYELYQERGGVDGNPTDDWLQAKQEVLRHKARAGTPSS